MTTAIYLKCKSVVCVVALLGATCCFAFLVASGRTPYQEVFSKLSANEISQLQFHSNDELSLHAAWSSHLTAAKVPQANLHALRARFSGFAEGRLKVSAPAWWLSMVADGTVEPGSERIRSNTFPTRRHRPGTKFWFEDEVHLLAHTDIGLFIQVGEAKFTIPKGLMDDAAKSSLLQVSISVQDKCCYVAFSGQATIPDVMLAKIDREESMVLWRKKLSGVGFRDMAVTWNHCTVVAGDSGRVYVFITMVRYLVIEGIDSENGDSVLFFNSENV